MSISLIRCLLAVLALSESFDVVASKDVAQLLGVKRPTIHRSLEMLQQKGLIHKEPYGDIHLTDDGMRMAPTRAASRRSAWSGSATTCRCCLPGATACLPRKACGQPLR